MVEGRFVDVIALGEPGALERRRLIPAVGSEPARRRARVHFQIGKQRPQRHAFPFDIAHAAVVPLAAGHFLSGRVIGAPVAGALQHHDPLFLRPFGQIGEVNGPWPRDQPVDRDAPLLDLGHRGGGVPRRFALVREVEPGEQDFLRRVRVFPQHGKRRLHHAEFGVMDDHAGHLAVDDVGGVGRRMGGLGPGDAGACRDQTGDEAGSTGHAAKLAAGNRRAPGFFRHGLSSLRLCLVCGRSKNAFYQLVVLEDASFHNPFLAKYVFVEARRVRPGARPHSMACAAFGRLGTPVRRGRLGRVREAVDALVDRARRRDIAGDPPGIQT